MILSLIAGNHDPINLLIRLVVALIPQWLLLELLQAKLVVSHVPFVWVGFGSHQRVLAKESDDELAHWLDTVVNGITGWMGTHIGLT